MGRQDTESADVSEAITTTEIPVLATIFVSGGSVTAASGLPGVVCRVNRFEDSGDTIITVGLDKSRWREIPAGSDEEQPVADDTVVDECMACGSRTRRQAQAGCLCESCWAALV